MFWDSQLVRANWTGTPAPWEMLPGIRADEPGVEFTPQQQLACGERGRSQGWWILCVSTSEGLLWTFGVWVCLEMAHLTLRTKLLPETESAAWACVTHESLLSEISAMFIYVWCTQCKYTSLLSWSESQVLHSQWWHLESQAWDQSYRCSVSA